MMVPAQDQIQIPRIQDNLLKREDAIDVRNEFVALAISSYSISSLLSAPSIC